jgi:hypothetical protein
MLGATPVPCVRNARRDDLACARERMGGLAPEHFELHRRRGPDPGSSLSMRRFSVMPPFKQAR